MTQPWLKSYDQSVPYRISYPDSTLHEILDTVADRYPDKTSVIWNRNRYTYAEIKKYSDKFAVYLLMAGIQKGERVGIVLPNSPHFIVIYYGILKAGGVVVAINPAYKEQEIRHIINHSVCKMIIADKDNENISRDFVFGDHHKQIICITSANENLDECFPWKTDETNYLSRLAGIGVVADDPAVFQYSGGTTGIPKAAIGLHRNLVANSYQFRYWLHHLNDGEEVVIAAIPLFHVYGMVIAMAMGMMIGAAIVIPNNPRDSHEVLQLMVDYGVTVFPGVPNQYYSLCQLPNVQNKSVDLSFIKVCISGSAPLNPEVKQLFEKLTGATIYEGYGLSEAPTATHCNPILGKNKPGSIGLPLPDVKCKIVSLVDNKRELGAGEYGELVIRGPQVMAGYYNAPDETTEVLYDGWLYTGDIAYIDEDGYFYIVERKKDMIKVGGLQVWPREVEDIIQAHPLVNEVGVTGIPTKYGGEYVKAWVVTKDNAVLTEQSIIEWCKERIALYKCPTRVEFLDKLPRSTVGKLLRRELLRSQLDQNSQ
jgi:long-chain acyl-CoA synthetase